MIFFIILLALFTSSSSVHSQETTATITIDAGSPAAAVNPLLLGYSIVFSGNGMWNTKLNDLDPAASLLVKGLAPTIVRFPGGSFSDHYIWEDGIGYHTTAPVAPTASSIPLDTPPRWGTVQKARFTDSAGGPFGDPFSFSHQKGKQLEGVSGLYAAHPAGAEVRPDARAGQPDWVINDYGINEHMKFVQSIGAQALLTANYGTGLDKSGRISPAASLSQRVKRAAAWVAYLNGTPTDSRPLGSDDEGTNWQTVGSWAQKRVARGHPAPYGVHYWEIGNETFGNWEPGFTTARQYATDCMLFATTMKSIDPTIAVGAAGLSAPHGRGDADKVDEWNASVVRIAGDMLDFLVVHPYCPAANRAQVQGSYANSEWFTAVMAGATQTMVNLVGVRAELAAISARGGQLGLAVTEYGIWPAESTDARDYSNLARALHDADVLMQLVAQGAQLEVLLATAWNLHGSNETAAIGYDWPTGARTLRPSYHAFRLMKSSLKQQQVRTRVTSPSFQTNRVANVEPRSEIPLLAAVATIDTQKSKLNLLVLNRSLTDSLTTTFHLKGFLPVPPVQIQTLHGSSIGAHNEDGAPTVETITSQLTYASSSFRYAFPPHSLTSMEFSAGSADP
jgi:alpha-L-arabinofuranosidase